MGYKLAESVKVENRKTFIANRRMRDIVFDYDLDSCDDVSYEEFQKLESGKDYAEIIYDKITDTSRWSVHHECVFKLGDKFYMTHYSEGATEIQDEAPYEYEGDWIEITEVVPKEFTVIKYVPKEENN